MNNFNKKTDLQTDQFTVEFRLISPESPDIDIQIRKSALEEKKQPEKQKQETKQDLNQGKAQIGANLKMILPIINKAFAFLALLKKIFQLRRS